MSNSSFDINLVYQSLRETKSRSNLNCAVGRIASLALAMTREKGMGGIASLALAMTREKRMGGIASLALAMTREKLFPLRERRRR